MSHSMTTENLHSLADYIEQKLNEHAEKPAYSALGQTLTFAEIDKKSLALAAWLQQKSGLTAGDRIAIQLPNLIQNPIAVYAAIRAGMVVVNTNPLYTPREMQHQFKDSGAKAIIILQDLTPKLNEIKDQTDIECVITTTAAELLSNESNVAQEGCVSFGQAITQGALLSLQKRPSGSLNDLCMLQYTGGTTGFSKGAALSHRNVLSNSLQMLERVGDCFIEGKEVVVCPLPLYHIYAFTVCMMAFFAKGSLTLLIPNPRDLDAFVEAMKPHKMTTFAGINTLFIGLSMHAEFNKLDFSTLKLTLSGGTALTQSAVDVWVKSTGCSITEGYGLSETAPVLTFNDPGNEHLGTVGRPLENTDIQLLDEQDQPLPDGEKGQIAAKGPQVMLGYWNRPEATAEVMTSNGYFKTGDIGIRMSDGCIKIVDRLKDMIIVSGFNVYPNEVENILTSHPSILEAAVVGAADSKTGEKVCAYITVKESVDVEEITDYCKSQLTAYKIPKRITVLEELPKSTVGKILRRELR